MTLLEWAAIASAYPFVMGLIVIWIRGATSTPTPRPPVSRPTLTVEAFGKPVARFEIIEHTAFDGERLEFHVPQHETGLTWTTDEVADTIAAIDRLPEPPVVV